MMILYFVIYQIIEILLSPVFVGYLFFRKIKKKSVFGSLNERIGLVPKVSRGKKTIWFHAVSVGEVLSLQSLVEKIKKKDPDIICYLTVGTVAGKKIAQEKLPVDIVSFLPFDFFLFMMLAFRRIKPTQLIIVEAEIWPNLLMLAHFKKIPTYLINARISERSKKRYTFGKKFLLPLFNIFEKIYTQSEKDRNEFTCFGLDKDKVESLGNIKAATVLEKQKKIVSRDKKNRENLLVGSIHPGELDIYLNLFEKLKRDYPNLQLTLAPRHFHWKEELIKKVEKNTYKKDIILICQMGKLFELYQDASIYFLGGTFVPIGGHNLLEPAAWATTTIVGPYHHNSAEIVNDLTRLNGIVIAKNKFILEEQVRKFLTNNELRKNTGNNARLWIENEGAQITKRLDLLVASLTSS
jgi:3-deoxy-D-manno-octulosonic-acid transferase